MCTNQVMWRFATLRSVSSVLVKCDEYLRAAALVPVHGLEGWFGTRSCKIPTHRYVTLRELLLRHIKVRMITWPRGSSIST